MPKGSEELTNARKEEIINACASLYETMGFKDITIRDIGAKTSFTRTSIYNYFQTKEEIFLALLEREHRLWIADLKEIARTNSSLSVDGFADKLARTLEKRGCMLKLMCMNLYDMEGNSRIENLVSFKKEYANALRAISCCLEKFFPSMGVNDIQEFLYALFPFLFGIYPYTSHTEKQMEAMRLAHVDYVHCTIYELTKLFVVKILRPFEG
ncbi:TetR/AcrR family transcriptional regulator [Ruminococcus sp. OA3]|uniref:TetR family transcriptional regulator n=1 Tax=Ruminococcus sp. OA3 TaxID=2914164 RepID=UPI001F06B750|nr:TetR family transcriptional regulator [Ruminococcus sp. OA3]MCH1983459.1 TetR/AcrR family transcriptional regulator [Ruminococcus sp. OA3]